MARGSPTDLLRSDWAIVETEYGSRCGLRSTIELLSVVGSTVAMFTRVNLPLTLGSKRISLVASVPTTVTCPLTGFTPTDMHRFIRPVAYVTPSVLTLITARSRSGRFQFATRPESAELAPETLSVQSWL